MSFTYGRSYFKHQVELQGYSKFLKELIHLVQVDGILEKLQIQDQLKLVKT